MSQIWNVQSVKCFVIKMSQHPKQACTQGCLLKLDALDALQMENVVFVYSWQVEKILPPPTNNFVTSSYVNNQWRHMRNLSANSYEDNISRTLECIQ